jgi:hypothetical protein
MKDAYVIASSIAAARMFAAEMGWKICGRNGIDFYDRYLPVKLITDPERLFHIRDAIIFVGRYERTREAQARKRVMMNRAEVRGCHVIEYDNSPRPQPLRVCVVCGADRPCMTDADLGPGEPGAPCTFDPTPYQLYKRMRAAEIENEELRRTVGTLLQAYHGIAENIGSIQGRIETIEQTQKIYRSPQERPKRLHSVS